MSDGRIGSVLDIAPAAFASRLGAEVSSLPAPLAERWIVRAPGSLDVMGGIAEYTGSVTLSVPTAAAALVSALPRTDQQLRVVCLGEGHNGQHGEFIWPLGNFYDSAQRPVAPAEFRRRLAEVSCRTAWAALSAAFVLLDSGTVPHLGGGGTIVVQSPFSSSAISLSMPAVRNACLAALGRLLAVDLDPTRIARLNQLAQQHIATAPAGIATCAGSLLGSGGSLLQLICQPFEIVGPMALPRGVAILGIDCGMHHPQADQKYVAARAAALMGREMIRRMLAPSPAEAARWDGYLARCSISDYVDRFRNRLPTRVRGSLYLERFGPLPDPLAVVDPAATYKVRSRTEHHIYENDRVRQFAERLARLSRTAEASVLLEAGELMYASHWSYGQRCGLGSIETDLLVNLLRAQGPAQGIFGSRISAGGCGGIVVALLADTDAARAAVERALAAYQQRSGRTTALLPAALPGHSAFRVEAAA